MAISVERAKTLAREAAGSALHELNYDYGQGRYRFFKTASGGPRQFGDSNVVVVMEDTGEVISGSAAPPYGPNIYEVRDFATDEVIRPMEVSRREYEQIKAESAQARAEVDAAFAAGEIIEPVPVGPEYWTNA